MTATLFHIVPSSVPLENEGLSIFAHKEALSFLQPFIQQKHYLTAQALFCVLGVAANMTNKSLQQ